MKRVLIIQAQMKQYRVPFFERLYAALRADGIQLRVAYSDPSEQEATKGDATDLPPEYGIKVRGYWAFRNRLLYQPLLRHIAAADLVVVEQASRYVLNHLLLLLSSLKVKKMAFWGLGENKQGDRSAISEWYKRMVLNRADWWFAYTSGTARFLASHGVYPQKITNVNNAVSTRQMRDLVNSVAPADLQTVKKQLGIDDEDRVGIYCGMLDRVKAIPFLLESARIVKRQLPAFRLLIVGGGPDRATIEQLVRNDHWIHCLGPKFRYEKAVLFKISDALLAPGRVGLVVLDSLAAGLPLMTTALPIHGPEIEYLESGHNGIMTEHDPQAYARAVISVLADPALLQKLKAGASSSAERYSIENMVESFRVGIRNCLQNGRG